MVAEGGKSGGRRWWLKVAWGGSNGGSDLVGGFDDEDQSIFVQ